MKGEQIPDKETEKGSHRGIQGQGPEALKGGNKDIRGPGFTEPDYCCAAVPHIGILISFLPSLRETSDIRRAEDGKPSDQMTPTKG